MTQSDRLIAEKDRCPSGTGTGWTWFEAEPEGNWIVCRESAWVPAGLTTKEAAQAG